MLPTAPPVSKVGRPISAKDPNRFFASTAFELRQVTRATSRTSAGGSFYRAPTRLSFAHGVFPDAYRAKCEQQATSRRLKWSIDDLPPEWRPTFIKHLWELSQRVRLLRTPSSGRPLTFAAIGSRLRISDDDARILAFVREPADLVRGVKRATLLHLKALYDKGFTLAEIAAMTGETESYISRNIPGGGRRQPGRRPATHRDAPLTAIQMRICELREQHLSFGQIEHRIRKEFSSSISPQNARKIFMSCIDRFRCASSR